jgi:hypothetical protein
MMNGGGPTGVLLTAQSRFGVIGRRGDSDIVKDDGALCIDLL